MARFRFGRPISLRWNGLLIAGPANTVFEIPDEYYEEFNQDIGGVEPTLVWLDSDEGSTLRARVTVLEGSVAPTLSNSNALALGTAAPGVLTQGSRADHVHPTTGLSLSGHNHAGVYDTAGTAAAAVSAHVAASDPHPVYLTDDEGDAQYSQLGHNHSGTYDPAGTTASAIATHESAADPHPTYLTSTEGNAAYSATGHTHTSFANNLQINKANSKVQLLNTTSGSGTEDGMYLLMADSDVGYLWNAETNGALVLGTGGAERARITPAGKFGIGTNSPSHQLEVVGPASVTVGVSAGGAGFAELELVGQAGKNYITSDDTLSFDIGGTERATVATTGLNVTSGTLSQGGTAVSLSGHTHSTANITSGNFAATVSGGTGVTVTGGTGNASTPSIAIGQAVATTNVPQFKALKLTDDVTSGYYSSTDGELIYRAEEYGRLMLNISGTEKQVYPIPSDSSANVGFGSTTVSGLLTGSLGSGSLNVNQGVILQRTTALSITTTTLPTTPSTSNTQLITWSSAVKANTGMWTSGSTITARVAGFHLINMNFQFATGASYTVGAYLFEGSTLRAHVENQAGTTAADMINLSAVMYLAAGATLTARVAASTTGKTISIGSQNGYISVLNLGAMA